MHDTQKQRIVELQKQIRKWERNASPVETTVFSTGCKAFDALFPDRGIRRGSLVEWVEDGFASGTGTLSLMTGRRVCPAGRPLVVVDLQRQISPQAVSLLGGDLSQLVVVRPDSEREALWACEEALRCRAVGLVWARLGPVTGTAFRRLQLAAEESAGVGFLMRSARALHQPSWAEVRLLVRPRPSREASPRLRVEVIYSQGRGGCPGADIQLDSIQGTIHEVSQSNQTDLMPLVPWLADPAACHRQARA